MHVPSSPISHHLDRLLVPIEIWPHVGAALAASLGDKPGLDIAME
jgi:hypothetical protein